MMVSEVKELYGINLTQHSFLKQIQNYQIALFKSMLEEVPLTKSSVFTTFYLNILQEEEVRWSHLDGQG
jgi:hypothetical protein